MIPVSCKHNTLSQPHVCLRRSTLEGQSGLHAPSSPHSAGAPLDLENNLKPFSQVISCFTATRIK